jgi:glycine oxidase
VPRFIPPSSTASPSSPACASPFQTTSTLEAIESIHIHLEPLDDPTELVPQLVPGDLQFAFLTERSIDPRQLAEALLAAIRNARVDLR